METTKLTLEDLKECIEIVLSGGEVELFMPEKGGGDIFRRVELRDYAETMLQGVVPVIYEKYVPRAMPGKAKETVKKGVGAGEERNVTEGAWEIQEGAGAAGGPRENHRPGKSGMV